MKPSFELLQHTADLRLRASAGSLPELVRILSAGFYSCIGKLKTDPKHSYADNLQFLSDAEPALLLRDYLAELLYRFSTNHVAAVELKVKLFTELKLDIEAVFQSVNLESSELLREVKAITYHELELRHLPEEFQFTCTLDL